MFGIGKIVKVGSAVVFWNGGIPEEAIAVLLSVCDPGVKVPVVAF